MQYLKNRFYSNKSLLIVCIGWLLWSSIIINTVIPTTSMEKTIMQGDRVLFLRFASVNPSRGDIVVFKSPQKKGVLYVKRIVGLPEETITIKNGDVWINGVLDTENSLHNGKAQDFFCSYVIPENCYFMLGDNRNNSDDSRFWANPFVERGNILGKAWFKYWPNPQLY